MRHQLLTVSILALAFLLLNILPMVAQTGKPQYTIAVSRIGVPLGEIGIELYPDVAPRHVANFDSLVMVQFYDGTAFHRVVPGFVIQGGGPNSKNGSPRETWGYGLPEQTTVPAEFSKLSHQRGILSAARSTDINSATSQFFICVASATNLDGKYSIYGRVISRLDLVDTIVNSLRDANDNPIDKIEMVVTRTGLDTAIPDIPALTLPADGTQRVAVSQSLAWDTVAGAILYNVQVATDEEFINIVAESMVPSPTFNVGSLETGLKQYYWRVSSTNGGRRSGYSEVRSFTTGIATPELVWPDNNAKDISTSPTLRWNHIQGALSYQLQISTSPFFSPVLVDLQDITDTAFQVTDLTTQTSYYWRVAASDEGSTTPYSGRRSFTTGVVGAVDNGLVMSATDLHVRIIGNDHVTISVQLDRTEAVRLVLVDAIGREVRTLLDEVRGSGEHQIVLDTRMLPQGVYFCRLLSNHFEFTRKLILTGL